MSAATMVMRSRDSESVAKTSSKTLRVNTPGDSFEREADHVADKVASGGHIPGWSLSPSDAGAVQRDTNTASALPAPKSVPMIGDPADPPSANNYGDMLGKLAEALMQTEAGKTIKKYLTDQPIVTEAKDFVETSTGVVIAGTTAVAAITGLAFAHKGLPAQLPAIPLDIIHPGVSVSIDVEGPLNHPTQGSLMFSFGAASPKKKKGGATDADRYRAETARIAEEQRYDREGTVRQGPLTSTAAQLTQVEGKRAINYAASRMLQHYPPGATHKPDEFTPLVPGSQPLSLGMRDNGGAKSAGDNGKKEEIPVQRKAESAASADFDIAPDVESVIHSSGHLLDSETRFYMESRIGFDFSKVRIHTDPQAAASARSLNARAYTVGNHVVFAPGRFAPNTSEGRRLIAHELTHVVQQGASRGKLHNGRALPLAVTPAPVQIQRDPDEDSKGISLFDSPRTILQKLSTKIPGYKLFTVIIAYDPLTGQPVTRNATNLVGGFLKMIGAEQTFKDLQTSGTLQAAFDWLEKAIGELKLSVKTVEDLISQAIDVGWANKFNGLSAVLRAAYGVFEPTLKLVKDFAFKILNKLGGFAVDAALKLLDQTGVLQTIMGVGDAISGVVKDPKGFATNLIKAVDMGFHRFGENIGDHFKNALLNWLFGALGNIEIPKEITFVSIFNVILKVLGLDYAGGIRPKLAKVLGEDVLSGLEKAVGIIHTIFTKGLGAAWEEIKGLANDLLQSFLTAAKDWAITTVVKVAAVKIVKLVAPGGAILEAFTAIYSTIEVIIRQAKKLQALIDGIAKSISKIVAGDITNAAIFIENVMAGTIPLMIDFLANYLGLGDVAATVRKILTDLKAKISAGLDKVIDYLVDKAKALWAGAKEKAAKLLEWWKQRREVTEGKEKHSIYLEGTEDESRLMVASDPARTWSEFIAEKVKGIQNPDPKKTADIQEIQTKAVELEKRLPPSKDDAQKAANVEAKRVLFDRIADLIVSLGLHRDSVEPLSVVQFEAPQPDGGGKKAIAKPLTSKFKAGTPPGDKPPIWTDLGSLIGKKNYKRGHLLNENLGGPGQRSNLTPITTKANAAHLADIEAKVKKAVLDDHQVVSYEVKAVYEGHSAAEKSKRMVDLEKLASESPLNAADAKELAELKAEQKLCIRFEYEAYELDRSGSGWAPKSDSKFKFKDKVDNTIEV